MKGKYANLLHKSYYFCEIWSAHSRVDDDCSILEYDTVWAGMHIRTGTNYQEEHAVRWLVQADCLTRQHVPQSHNLLVYHFFIKVPNFFPVTFLSSLHWNKDIVSFIVSPCIFVHLVFSPTYALIYIIKILSQAVTLIAHITPTCFDPYGSSSGSISGPC